MYKISARLRRPAVVAAALAGTVLTGCTVQDSLLEQQQPQIIRPTDVQSATGALALYNGAIGRFRSSLSGGNNNQETIWNFEGLMTDEIGTADSFSQRNDADQRITQTNDATLTPTYNSAQQSRGFARDAINSLKQYAPTETTKIGEMYFELGFFELTLGQAFCNGIPLGETVNGIPNYTDPLTDQAVFTTAIARFDTALATITATDAAATAVKNAVLIAKARALVNQKSFAAAAALVTAIPTTYAYNITYSKTTQSNEWWQMANVAGSKRYNVGDSVDYKGNRILNAIPFASAKDPRVLSHPVPGTVGLDTSTPFVSLDNWGQEDPVPLVTGIDARLIEAEAKLNAGDIAGTMTILNTLRTTSQKLGSLTVAAQAALPTPATQAAAVDVFFREKAFWQYGRGERFEDLRRLVRQYGRPQDTVWPSGVFFKGGVYGTNVTFPVPDAEKTNPKFSGCIDMNA